jgi:hypothetical protein
VASGNPKANKVDALVGLFEPVGSHPVERRAPNDDGNLEEPGSDRRSMQLQEGCVSIELHVEFNGDTRTQWYDLIKYTSKSRT